MKAYTRDVEARLPSFQILKVCRGELLVSRFDRFIYVKRAALTSDRRLCGVSTYLGSVVAMCLRSLYL